VSGFRKFPEPFPPAKTVKVKSSSGSIHIQGARQNNVTYTIREQSMQPVKFARAAQLSHMKFTTYSSGETVVLAGGL